MALKGTLQDFGLADIFQLIGIQRKTGVLAVKHGDHRVQVSFLSGSIVSAESSVRALEGRLGVVLVKSGKITDRQLGEALKTQKSTLQRLGKILIDQKALTQEELQEALRVQVNQIVHHLFRWRDGEYDFSQEETIDYDRENFVPIPADSILMEGARMIDEWPIIERRIRSFDIVLRRKSGGSTGDQGPISVFETDIDFGLMSSGRDEKDDEGIRMTREQALVLRLVDGHSTVQDIIDRSQLGEFDACRILHDLISRELVEEGLENKEKPAPAAAISPGSFLCRAALLLLPLLAAASVIYSFESPLSPIRGGIGRDPFGIDRMRAHLSQARVGRVDQALRLYHLDRQGLPPSLDHLVLERMLDPDDLLDPWGRPYLYRTHPGGYDITGFSPSGEPDESISVQNQFVAAERLAFEGRTGSMSKAASWP